MIIIECKGHELEKEKSNTSEDFFNKSEITFVEEGHKRTLNILYVRYFDESFAEFTPFSENPVFQAGSREVRFVDLVALVCLLKNPGLRGRKRLYINSQKEFIAYFKDIDFNKIPEIFKELEERQEFHLSSPLEFIVQPK